MTQSAQPLMRWERRGLIGLGVLLIVLGVEVERRSAFMSRRMGDVGCYLRAGWAVRSGHDLYGVTCDNGWHYLYPPLYAILMTPLADPPRGADASGMTPYPVSVAVCYLLNLLWLALGAHWLASALESRFVRPELRSPPAGCRRWWALRVVPVLACLPTLGHTLVRGQVNTLLLMCLCGLIAGLMTGRRAWAGVSLAGAICLKIIPAFLLLVPLWRRDGRCLLGCAAGLLVGLVLIPWAALGWGRTADAYTAIGRQLFGPVLGVGADQTLAEELTDTAATDSQSFLVVIHNTAHWRLPRWERPRQAATGARAAHLLIGAALTLATLAAARRGRGQGQETPLLVGCLALVMILLSPVCHTHYFCLELPLVMALLARSWDRRGEARGDGVGRPDSPVDRPLLLLLVVLIAGNALPQLGTGPDLEQRWPALALMRLLLDCGLAMYVALGLWFVSVLALRRGPHIQAPRNVNEARLLDGEMCSRVA
jgi:hypothetical protein